MSSVNVTSDVTLPSETSFTNEVTCPWCQYEHGDSWEIDFEGNETTLMECPSCYNEIRVYRHVEVTYCTTALAPGSIEQERQRQEAARKENLSRLDSLIASKHRDNQKALYWGWFKSRKDLWPVSVTAKRLEKYEQAILNETRLWAQILDRFDGVKYSPEEMSQQSIFKDMCGNFSAIVREIVLFELAATRRQKILGKSK